MPGRFPLGHEAFIRQYMSTLTAGYVSYMVLLIQRHPDPVGFLVAAPQPEETETTCQYTVDAELRDAVEALTYHGAMAPSLTPPFRGGVCAFVFHSNFHSPPSFLK